MNTVAVSGSAIHPAFTSEAEVVRLAARGDTASIRDVYLSHGEVAWRLAQAVGPDTGAAVGALGDGFVGALRAHRSGRRRTGQVSGFRDQLLGAVYRSAVERARAGDPAHVGRRRPADADVALSDAAFRSLPERWRAAVWLSEVERLDTARIAAVMGVSAPVAAQLESRGRRGLAGRFEQARHPVPDHFGEVLRAVCLAAPADLAEVITDRMGRAAHERSPVVAPAAAWLSDRAARPLTVAAGALMGLGLIGLGVVPETTSLHASVGAGGTGSLAGAQPVHTCYGLACPSPGGGPGSLLGGAGRPTGSVLTTTTPGSGPALAGSFSTGPPGSSGAPGGTGGSAATSHSAPTASARGGTGSGGSGGTGTSGGGGGTTPGSGALGSGGSGTGSGGSGTGSGGSGTGSISPPSLGSTSPTTTQLSLAPVATVTQGGSGVNVTLLPSGSGGAASVSLGCSSELGVSLGSTSGGCPTTTTAPSAGTTTTTTTTNPVSGVVSGVTGVVSSLGSGL